MKKVILFGGVLLALVGSALAMSPKGQGYDEKETLCLYLCEDGSTFEIIDIYCQPKWFSYCWPAVCPDPRTACL
jgi:hypothetical protein